VRTCAKRDGVWDGRRDAGEQDRSSEGHAKPVHACGATLGCLLWGAFFSYAYN